MGFNVRRHWIRLWKNNKKREKNGFRKEDFFKHTLVGLKIDMHLKVNYEWRKFQSF